MEQKQDKKIESHVSEKKISIVRELSDLIKNNKTFLIASIKNLPASQFQEIGKRLRKEAVIKVPRKNLILRAIDSSGNEKIKELKNHIQENTAILFSNKDSFELAAELIENKSPSAGKAGQEAPEDIEVQEGPTELLPGPAITELGSLGIQIQIDKGKINIKAPKVIVKKGEKISENAASVMNKLDIKPFFVGFIPLMAYDSEEEKLYLEIVIDKEKTLEDLKTSFNKSLGLAVEIGYSSDDTISFMIGKAGTHEKVLEKLFGTEEVEEKEEPKEEVSEEAKENTQEENSEEENK